MVTRHAVDYAQERLDTMEWSAKDHPDYEKGFAAVAEAIEGLRGKVEHVEILALEEAIMNDSKNLAVMAYLKGLQDGNNVKSIG